MPALSVEQYFYFQVYVDGTKITSGDLDSLYYGIDLPDGTDSSSSRWKTNITKNNDIDTGIHIEMASQLDNAILYYSCDADVNPTPTISTSYIWVKLTKGGSTYIKKVLISGSEIGGQVEDGPKRYCDDIRLTDDDKEPVDPPISNKTYRIFVKSSGTNKNINDEDIWVGNNPGGPGGKYKMANMNYVDFTWQELIDAVNGLIPSQ